MLESFFDYRHDGVKSTAERMALDINSTLLEQDSEVTSEQRSEFSDEALMSAYAQGNVKAFEKLYLKHKDPLLRYFLRQVNGHATAEELFQETWQSLIKNSANYKSSAKFTTYLYTIAHSRLIDFYRKSGKAQFESMDNDDDLIQFQAEEDSQPEFQISANELKEQLLSALDALAPNQKEVFLLKFEAGMSVPEIAEILGQNPEAVKSRLRYCVANLKGFFNREELVEG